MNKEQANLYLKILEDYYGTEKRNPFENLIIKRKYGEFFMGIDESVMADLIDKILSTYTFFPKLAELIDFYEAIRPRQIEKQNTGPVKCWVCMDKGYVFIHDNAQGYDLYCDSCEAGNKWKYDSQSMNKKLPQGYRNEAVSSELNPFDLERHNKQQQEGNGRQAFLDECKRLGINAKFILQPRERVKEECPF